MAELNIFSICDDSHLNKFNATFVDPCTGNRFTATFRQNEPVLYHPSHQAKPSLTHISYISKHGYFVVGESKTNRMIPFALAQSTLHIKMTLEDIEREVAWGVRTRVERVRSTCFPRISVDFCPRFRSADRDIKTTSTLLRTSR